MIDTSKFTKIPQKSQKYDRILMTSDGKIKMPIFFFGAHFQINPYRRIHRRYHCCNMHYCMESHRKVLEQEKITCSLKLGLGDNTTLSDL
jgi:hypothetical protein